MKTPTKAPATTTPMKGSTTTTPSKTTSTPTSKTTSTPSKTTSTPSKSTTTPSKTTTTTPSKTTSTPVKSSEESKSKATTNGSTSTPVREKFEKESAPQKSGKSVKETVGEMEGKKKVEFAWGHGGAEKVSVTGSWCEWKNPGVVMKKGEDGVWKAEVGELKKGEKYCYKFIVDGEWCYDFTKDNEDDGTGCINNVITAE